MKKFLVIVAAAIVSITTSMTAFAGWYQENGKWKYQEDGKNKFQYKRIHTSIDGKQYYFDEEGYMVTGWYQFRDGSWKYYGDDGALVRNQWIDGKYYVGFDGTYIPERTNDTADEKQESATQNQTSGTVTYAKEDLSAWNQDFPLYMAMSDSLRAQASDVGCIAINRGDSDMVIYSAMARTTNDILGSAATRYMYLTYSNDGVTWQKALSVRVKPQEQIYLNFIIVGDPIVSGISTSLNYVVEYHGVAYIVSKEPEQEKTWSVPLQSIYPNGEFTLADFQNNTWPQEIKTIFGIN